MYAWLDRCQVQGVPGLIAHLQGGSAGGIFSDRQPVLDRLRQGPGEEAREMAVTDTTPPPRRWTLRTICATFDIFSVMTLSGVWGA